jgi:hypothetical protein
MTKVILTELGNVMDKKALIYRLIYHAFLDIRSTAQNGERTANTIAYNLSDVFHNVPLRLNRVESEGGDYNQVLLNIRERAKRAKCEGWLDNVIRQY